MRASNRARDLPDAIDRPRLERLVCNQIEIIGEIAAVFAETTANLIDAIGRALETRDASAICRLAHSIKGSSATVGAESLADLSQRLEHLARDGRLADAGRLLQEVEQEFSRASAELDAIAAGDAPAPRT